MAASVLSWKGALVSTLSRTLSERQLSGATVAAGNVVPLSTMRRGCRGVIRGFTSDAPGNVARRLFDLGFAAGQQVDRERRAWLGDPTIYRINNTDVALRKTDAKFVQVEVISPGT